MVLPIYAFGQPVLKLEAEEIDPKLYPDLNILLENMWDTMKNARGVGLAAPQIGVGIKLFVIDTTPYTKDEDEQFLPLKKVFINAIISEESGTSWPFEEGCLSIPDIRADVERLSTIKIEYIDELGQKIIETHSGLNARVIQHEYDHTIGVLFIDHLKPLKKRMLQRRLENIKKGQIECDYKVKFYRGVK